MKKPSADDLAALVAEADSCFSAITNSDLLEQEKSRYLGKNGAFAPWLAALKGAPPSERQGLGAAINRAKQSIEEALKTRREFLQQAKLQKKLQAEAVDVTLPGRGMGRGGLHPITQAQERIALLFHSLGFVSVDGPEIETDDYNFTALNTPQNHPARSMQDTFYLRDMPDTLLRTHTSPVQIRAMRLHRETHPTDPMPDLRILASGRVYRVDSDATHSPMFHQIEGLWVGEKISFADLKGMMVDFLRTFFDSAKLQIRFRPSYFPFTEPSAEIDMAFQSGSWLEIAGCGMVHPQVLRNGNIDPQRYSGVAFGAGLERLTMLRHAITDLRHFYTGDLSFLNQFN